MWSYFDRFWELYNDIGVSNEQVAASTFKVGLSYYLELRESLTRQPQEDVHQLMRCVKEYKRLEDDRLQNRGMALFVFHDRKETIMGVY